MKKNESIEIQNERMEYLLEGAGLGAWDWWLESNKVAFDRRWCEMLGLKLEDIPQELSSWDNLVHPDDKEKAYADIKAYLDGKTKVYENIHRLKHKDGHWVWILDRGRTSEYGKDGKAIRFTGTHFDISAYKEQESLLMDIQEMANIGGWELDVATGKTKWTKKTYDIHKIPLNTPTDKILGINFYAPKDRPRITKFIENCLNGEPYKDVFEFYDAQGRHKWVEASGKPVKNAQGKVYKLVGTFQDITEEKENRIKLERAEIVGKTGSFHFNLKNNNASWSKGHNAIFNLQNNEKPSFETFLAKLHPEDRHLPLQILDEIKKNKNTYFQFNFRIILEDGSIRYIKEHGNVDFDQNMEPEIIQGLVIDITEETILNKKIEEEKIKTNHQAKLASLGEMSAGIAHEISNPLSIISGSISLLRNYMDNEEKFNLKINAIEKSIYRINKIITGLRKFARISEQEPHKKELLKSIIEESIMIVNSKLQQYNIILEKNIDDKLIIECDPVEIEQVFINLISNAADAIKDQEEKWIKINSFCENDHIVCQIIDSGKGISTLLKDKIFQPFFTTKPVGDGTGLGLSISKGILDNHNAPIEINSNFENTCFEIKFPK